MTRVLVVDDEPQIVRALRINLRARQYEVYTATSGTEALAQAAHHPPDIVILDLGLPDLDGIEVITGSGVCATAASRKTCDRISASMSATDQGEPTFFGRPAP